MLPTIPRSKSFVVLLMTHYTGAEELCLAANWISAQDYKICGDKNVIVPRSKRVHFGQHGSNWPICKNHVE